MKRFIEGEDHGQGTWLPALLDDYIAEANPVSVVDVFVEARSSWLPVQAGEGCENGAAGLSSDCAPQLYIYGYRTASSPVVGLSEKPSVKSK